MGLVWLENINIGIIFFIVDVKFLFFVEFLFLVYGLAIVLE